VRLVLSYRCSDVHNDYIIIVRRPADRLILAASPAFSCVLRTRAAAAAAVVGPDIPVKVETGCWGQQSNPGWSSGADPTALSEFSHFDSILKVGIELSK